MLALRALIAHRPDHAGEIGVCGAVEQKTGLTSAKIHLVLLWHRRQTQEIQTYRFNRCCTNLLRFVLSMQQGFAREIPHVLPDRWAVAKTVVCATTVRPKPGNPNDWHGWYRRLAVLNWILCSTAPQTPNSLACRFQAKTRNQIPSVPLRHRCSCSPDSYWHSHCSHCKSQRTRSAPEWGSVANLHSCLARTTDSGQRRGAKAETKKRVRQILRNNVCAPNSRHQTGHCCRSRIQYVCASSQSLLS